MVADEKFNVIRRHLMENSDTTTNSEDNVTGTSSTTSTSSMTGTSSTTTSTAIPLLAETPDVHDNMMSDGYDYHIATGALYSGTGTTGTGTAVDNSVDPTGTSTTGTSGITVNSSVDPTGTAGGTSTATGTGSTSGTPATTGIITDIQGSDAHHNFLEAGSDDAVLHAGSAGDIMVGGTGTSNVLVGGAGDDTMIGGSAANTTNTLNGGSGSNTMVAAGTLTQETSDFLHAHESVVVALDNDPMMAAIAAVANGSTTTANVSNVFQVQSGSFHDDIYNFHASSDVVQIQSNINGSGITNLSTLLSHITVSGNDLSIDVGGGSTVNLVGVDVPHLSAANVTFVV